MTWKSGDLPVPSPMFRARGVSGRGSSVAVTRSEWPLPQRVAGHPSRLSCQARACHPQGDDRSSTLNIRDGHAEQIHHPFRGHPAGPWLRRKCAGARRRDAIGYRAGDAARHGRAEPGGAGKIRPRLHRDHRRGTRAQPGAPCRRRAAPGAGLLGLAHGRARRTDQGAGARRRGESHPGADRWGRSERDLDRRVRFLQPDRRRNRPYRDPARPAKRLSRLRRPCRRRQHHHPARRARRLGGKPAQRSRHGRHLARRRDPARRRRELRSRPVWEFPAQRRLRCFGDRQREGWRPQHHAQCEADGGSDAAAEAGRHAAFRRPHGRNRLAEFRRHRGGQRRLDEITRTVRISRSHP